ncbi:hypothetical protein D1872_81530 [compost metagenome]
MKMPYVETVIKEKYKTDYLTFSQSSVTDRPDIQIEIKALIPERSCEERHVYFEFNGESFWLNAEDASLLGQKLIEHATKSFRASLLIHQQIHETRKLFQWVRDGLIEKVILTVIDRNPANYGKGHYLFHIEPVFHKEIEGYEYEKAFFAFEKVIYFSPFEDVFKEQIEPYGNVEFVDYDRDEEVRRFEKECEKFSEDLARERAVIVDINRGGEN